MGIDEFVRHGRLVDQHAEPAEGIDPLEGLERRSGNTGARDAVIAVASGDEVALEHMRLAILAVLHPRAVAIEIEQPHVAGFVDGRGARSGAGVHQVVGHLGLPVDHHMTVDEAGEVEAVRVTVKTQFHAVVDEAFPVHAFAHADRIEQFDRALFENPGTNSAQHVFGAAPLQNDGVHAGALENASEHQTSRSCADNGNLSSQSILPKVFKFYRLEGASQWTEAAKRWTIRA
jgi:hypothetical protein